MEEQETFILRRGQQLTQEQKERLANLANLPDDEIICDEDCPELTDEQLSRMVRVSDKKRKSA